MRRGRDIYPTPRKTMRSENFLRFLKKTVRVFVSCLFICSLFLSLNADNKQCEWDNIKKIVAVGDLHGDYDNCVKILKAAGLIDDTLKWIGGDTHLVQTGDIIDRGDHAKEIFDLIMRLEIEAEEAGGKVHMLIGNHEELNITGMALGTPGYVSKTQFLAFIPDSFREKKEKEFKKIVEKSLEKGNNSSAAFIDIEEWWTNQITRDRTAQHEYTINFNENYGIWIIEHNAVIRINDVIFVHGGISERFSTWPLEKINETFREELNMYRLAYKRGRIPMYKPEIVYVHDAPHWFRDLALKDEEYFTAEANKILKNLGVSHMVIAHTPAGSGGGSPIVGTEGIHIIHKFKDRVWIIDTGISDYYGGVLSYLTIENGKFSTKEWRDEE